MNSRAFTNIALVLVALLLVAILALKPSHAAGKIQYKHVDLHMDVGANVQQQLNKYAGDGWEFAGSYVFDRNGQPQLNFIFKKATE